jgi:hypothetical protein
MKAAQRSPDPAGSAQKHAKETGTQSNETWPRAKASASNTNQTRDHAQPATPRCHTFDDT